MKPKKVYKYKSPGKYLFDILKNNYLYFSLPQEFNDPFDCRIVVDHDGDLQDWLGWAKSLDKPSDIKQEVIRQIKSNNFEPSQISRPPSNENNQQVIHCFSEIHDNLLMWSHYTNNHKGVCIGYEVNKEFNSPCIYFDDNEVKPFHPSIKNGAVPLIPVTYKKSMPKPVDFFNKKEEDIIRFLVTKSNEWEYEKEWRALYPTDKIQNQKITIRKDLIKEIYLGAKIEKGTRDKILEIVSEEYLSNGYNIDVYELELADRSYSLNEKKLKL